MCLSTSNIFLRSHSLFKLVIVVFIPLINGLVIGTCFLLLVILAAAPRPTGILAHHNVYLPTRVVFRDSFKTLVQPKPLFVYVYLLQGPKWTYSRSFRITDESEYLWTGAVTR